MYSDSDLQRGDELRQQAAAAVIQREWRSFTDRRGTYGNNATALFMPPASTAGTGMGMRDTDDSHIQTSAGAVDTSIQTTLTSEERRSAYVEEYRALLEEREALLDKNLAYQQVLSRHYAEQRRRNGETESNQLTTPDAETAYWTLIRQVSEERQRVAGRGAALKKDLELQRQRYEPIMEEVAMQEHNFQECIQEIAASVRFMRSNRPIPTDAIDAHVRREAEQRSAIRTARVRYLQLKNRLLQLRRAAKGGGVSSSSTAASPGTTGEGGEELNSANHHMFLIDFEQLKVENTSLNEKIEERSEEVLKLRNKVTNTIHIASHVREKLDCVRKENAELRQHVASTDEELGGARDQLAKSKRRRDAHLRANMRMKERMPLVGSRELLLDYEKRKAVIHEFRTHLVQLRDRYKEFVESTSEQEAACVSLRHELSHYPR